MEFLATRLEEFDVSNNALTNAEIPKLHALVNLEFLAIGGNDEVFNNTLIAELEDALIDTDINYSNLNTALVRFFKFDLTFSAEALAIPEQIGTLRLVTDYWPADEPDKAFIFREFSEPVSLLLETTAGDMLMGDMGMNQDVFTRALSYIVDLTRINAALSCNAEATVSSDVSGYPSLPEWQDELITVAVDCWRSTSAVRSLEPSSTSTSSKLRPRGRRAASSFSTSSGRLSSSL